MNTCKKMVGIMLVLLLGSSTAFAQPIGRNGMPPGLEGKQTPPGLEKRPVLPRPHIEPLLSAQGFALSGDEFHLLSVSLTRTRVIPPRDMQEMLRGNKSFEDMLGELEKDGRAVVLRGTLKFGTKHYALNVTDFDNKTLEADIVTLPQPRMPPTNESAVEQEVIGHVRLSVSAYEGARIAAGEITIEDKSYRALTVAASQIIRTLNGGALESVEPPMKERGDFGKERATTQGKPGMSGGVLPLKRVPFQGSGFPF